MVRATSEDNCRHQSDVMFGRNYNVGSWIIINDAEWLLSFLEHFRRGLPYNAQASKPWWNYRKWYRNSGPPNTYQHVQNRSHPGAELGSYSNDDLWHHVVLRQDCFVYIDFLPGPWHLLRHQYSLIRKTKLLRTRFPVSSRLFVICHAYDGNFTLPLVGRCPAKSYVDRITFDHCLLMWVSIIIWYIWETVTYQFGSAEVAMLVSIGFAMPSRLLNRTWYPTEGSFALCMEYTVFLPLRLSLGPLVLRACL